MIQLISGGPGEAGANALQWADREGHLHPMLRRSMEAFQLHANATAPLFAARGIGVEDTQIIDGVRFIAAERERSRQSA